MEGQYRFRCSNCGCTDLQCREAIYRYVNVEEVENLTAAGCLVAAVETSDEDSYGIEDSCYVCKDCGKEFGPHLEDVLNEGSLSLKKRTINKRNSNKRTSNR